MASTSDDRETADDNSEALGFIGPHPGDREHRIVIGTLHMVERLFLLSVAVMTLVAAGQLLVEIWNSRAVTLADILLMFLFTEVIAMAAVFYSARKATFIYPIFIAITALARLVVLQSKEMAPENIVFETGAILLLSLGAWVLSRNALGQMR